MNILSNIILFIVVMLLTIVFVREATAQPVQDTENTCHQTNTCKPTGSVNNPFEENRNELR